MTRRAGLFFGVVFGITSSVSSGIYAAEQDTKLSVRPRKADSVTPPPSIRADVSLILVPVSVTDVHDRPITALPKESFRLLEDGVEQTIVSFAREEAAVSMGLLVDSSGSMKNRL